MQKIIMVLHQAKVSCSGWPPASQFVSLFKGIYEFDLQTPDSTGVCKCASANEMLENW
jgi:hypothetical protein